MSGPRRRFFPARAVQQVPGETVEFGVQLRKQGAVAAVKACECEVLGVAWFGTLTSAGADLSTSPDDDDPALVVAHDWLPSWAADLTTKWVRPEGDDPDRLPPEGPGTRCVAVRTDASERAALFGAIIGAQLGAVRWVLRWDNPGDTPARSGRGQEAVVAGNGLWIAITGGLPDGPPTETLTATATCNGSHVGTLTLTIDYIPIGGES